jgi:hypothetical protein
VLPGSARRGPGVEDDELDAQAAQVVAGGEPCLAAADHHYLGDGPHDLGGRGRVNNDTAPNAVPQITLTVASRTKRNITPVQMTPTSTANAGLFAASHIQIAVTLVCAAALTVSPSRW